MKLLILSDENGLRETDESFLTKIGSAKALTVRRNPFNMAIKQGSSAIPILCFDNEEDEGLFFDDVDKKGSVTVFTTLPGNLLIYFTEQFFLDTGKLYKIKCRQAKRHKDFPIYSDRLIEFVKETRIPGGRHPDTLVKNRFEEGITAYRAYPSPIILDVPEADLLPFYEKLYRNQKDLPIALPAGMPTGQRSYFGNYIKNNTSIPLYEIREIIKNATEEMSTNEDLARLFFSLWTMTDKPIISEYLKEGSFFSFHSSPAGKPNILNDQAMDGSILISFNFPNETLYPDDVLIQWHTNLLNINDEQSAEINDIKRALLGDIETSIPGTSSLIVATNERLKGCWDIIQFDDFDSTRSRSMDGTWTEIKDFQNLIKTKNIIKDSNLFSDFIESTILNIAERQGNIPHDHVLALTLFSEYLCKFPFSYIQSSSEIWKKNDISVFKEEWKKYCFDLVASLWGLFPNRKIPSLDSTGGYHTYQEPLNPRDIFLRRISLPPNIVVRSGFSSRLNLPNALNNNFILQP